MIDPRKVRFTTKTSGGRKIHFVREGHKTLYQGSAKDVDKAKVDLLLQLVSDQRNLIDELREELATLRTTVLEHRDTFPSLQEQFDNIKQFMEQLEKQIAEAIFVEPIED